MGILTSNIKRIFLPFIMAYFALYPQVSSFALDASGEDRLLKSVQPQANSNTSNAPSEGVNRGGVLQSLGFLPGFELSPQTKDTPMVKTGATPRKIPGSMAFRHEMAGLLGEKVGPDSSGDVYHAGGLAAYYTGPKELFPGKGKFGHLYKFLPVIRWYDPAHYFNTNGFHPGSPVNGEFTNEQCVACHNAENPGIVAQWRQSKHGAPPAGKEVVGCDRCHGKNHEKLAMPSCDLCGECHAKQLKGHREGGRALTRARLSPGTGGSGLPDGKTRRRNGCLSRLPRHCRKPVRRMPHATPLFSGRGAKTHQLRRLPFRP